MSGVKFDFSGKKAVVAGGSRGIGRAIALAFAEAGAAVAICARNKESLDATAAELRRLGKPVHAAPCDLADGAQIPVFIEGAAKALGGIDILVNNASGFGRTDDEAGWGVSVAVDLMATVRASQAALPHIERAGGGSLIHITSIAGLKPSIRTPPYGAIKAALNQLTLTQAASLAAKNIRVNAIAPGSIEFPGGVWAQAKAHNKGLYNQILGRIPFGRLGRPEEIADVALFLASDAASWVTGVTLIVDGGQTLT